MDITKSIDKSTVKPVVIAQNAHGGVLVTNTEMKLALELYDPTKKESFTKQGIKETLSKFGKEISEKELKVLHSGDEMLDLERMEQLLSANEVTEFDPAKEAFKVSFHL